MTNDGYSWSTDYYLCHLGFEVLDFDWDSTSFDGRVLTTLIAIRPGLDSVILDAGSRLVVTRPSNDVESQSKSRTSMR